MEIDTAMIQETHQIIDGGWGEGGYIFYTTSAGKSEQEEEAKGKKKKQSGTAMVYEDLRL